MIYEDVTRRTFWPRFLSALVSTIAGLMIWVRVGYGGVFPNWHLLKILTFIIACASWMGTLKQLIEDEMAIQIVREAVVGGELPW